uniref:Uncharacterized protein n=1 Tax=Solanum tuberosum TaxID=4113 RepID=M1DNI7_SOLTU
MKGYEAIPLLLRIEQEGPMTLTLILVARIIVDQESEDWYSKFEGKHGHYRAKRRKRSQKSEKMKISESPNPFGESPIDHIFAFCSSVLSPGGKDQIGGEKEQLACR